MCFPPWNLLAVGIWIIGNFDDIGSKHYEILSEGIQANKSLLAVPDGQWRYYPRNGGHYKNISSGDITFKCMADSGKESFNN